MVDTGTPITLLDKSLEPQLGKRLGTTTFWNFRSKSKIGIYDAPKLYLGQTELRTAARVYTGDFKKLSTEIGRPVMGILGMDCMRNYSIQLDFETGKMRFLDPNQPHPGDLGAAFPIIVRDGLPYIHHDSFLGKKELDLMVDTGCMFDGLLKASRFPREAGRQRSVAIGTCTWNDNTYTDLFLAREEPDIIGLRFLARHVVTLNFPEQKMYLRQTSIGSLANNDIEAATPVVKSSDDSPLKLQSADRADKNSVVTERFPTP